jgi:hypothetical protein
MLPTSPEHMCINDWVDVSGANSTVLGHGLIDCLLTTILHRRLSDVRKQANLTCRQYE